MHDDKPLLHVRRNTVALDRFRKRRLLIGCAYPRALPTLHSLP